LGVFPHGDERIHSGFISTLSHMGDQWSNTERQRARARAILGVLILFFDSQAENPLDDTDQLAGSLFNIIRG
jgi:hypothetical protein